MKKTILLLILALAMAGCGSGGKLPPSHLTWTWDEDQSCITGENIWAGFSETKEGFQAEKPISSFALWRKTPPGKITLVYVNKSRFPVKLAINGAVVASLPFSSKYRRFVLSTPLLQKGINIIGFLRRNRKKLVVKELCLSQGKGENFVLEKGEGLIIPVDGGGIKFSLRGRGKARVSVHYGQGFSKLRETGINNPLRILPSRVSFSSHEPYLVEIRVSSGGLRPGDFKFSSGKENKNPPGTNLRFRKPYPNIFIFLIDACQASHLSLYGYPRKTSPNIDKLGEESLVFENAYTNAAFTRATVASIFSGLFPEHHKVRVLRAALDSRLLLLPEFLKTKGYTTSIFTASANVSATFGFSQGIDQFFGYYGRWNNRTSQRMARDFLRWIARKKGPKFSYIHFMEPHFPIIPPHPFKNMFKKNPPKIPVMKRMRQKIKSTEKFSPQEVQDIIDDYDSTIAYIDSILGRIWEGMRKMGVFENSMIIFLSDHGEALYEHGAFGHGPIVYEEMTHIPLVVKLPAYIKMKGRIKALVQPTDIFPTVASLFGVELALDGRSLLEAALQRIQGDEIAVARNFLNPGAYGIRWRKYYYIINMRGFKEELYTVKGYPARSYPYENQAVTLYLRGQFLKWLKKYQNLSMVERKISFKKLSRKELENLRSLGYIK